jgi:hypothetical protein
METRVTSPEAEFGLAKLLWAPIALLFAQTKG